ncbi:MAG: menaquinone biosynthesis protein [Bacteroidales bacterium]
MKDKKPLISAVSYLNTLPFLYGINHSELKDEIDFELDIPSICASKLINNQVDIALMPVAGIPFVNRPQIISDYCLGALKRVKTVLLFSDVPLDKIEAIFLDYQSRTSVNLVKILTHYHWKISPRWIEAKEGFENKIQGKKAGVIIGDRTFKINKDFEYAYDLSLEWYEMTGLPFVFAAWAANKPINEEFCFKFNQALSHGIENIDLVVDEYFSKHPNSVIDLKDYLLNNISFYLDEAKKESMSLFFKYMAEMKLISEPLTKKIIF